jgi:hypothetical protein
MSGHVYRIYDFDAPKKDDSLGTLSLGEVEDALDHFVCNASNESWEAALRAGDDIYLYVDGGVVHWGTSRAQVQESYETGQDDVVD